MSITTKKGDRGKTSLCFGKMVDKDNLRVEIYGSLDELCSFLGLARSLIKNKKIKKMIELIQRDLFIMGAEIATETIDLPKLKKRMTNSSVEYLEKEISQLEPENKFKDCCFCLPGENVTSSYLDIARTITRRIERRTISLKKKKKLRNQHIIVYLNRLSDLLFLLARSFEDTHRTL